MPEIFIDNSQAVDFTDLPDGTYEVELAPADQLTGQNMKYTDPTTGQSVAMNPCPGMSNANNPVLQWEMICTGSNGQDAAKGRRLWRKTPIMGKGAGITESTLKAFGVPFQGEGEKQGFRFNTDDCPGRRAFVVLKTGPGKDKDGNPVERQDIKKMLPVQEAVLG